MALGLAVGRSADMATVKPRIWYVGLCSYGGNGAKPGGVGGGACATHKQEYIPSQATGVFAMSLKDRLANEL